MLELALEMIFCLIVAAILGGLIGYLLGRISKCNDNDSAKNIKARALKGVAKNTPDATLITKNKTSTHLVGIKPTELEGPDDGVGDDLKEISGIGLKIEEALNSLGIFHFHQIAEWTQDNINWIDKYLVFKGRVNREDWVAQAKLLAVGGNTNFSKKVKNGKIDRYR